MLEEAKNVNVQIKFAFTCQGLETKGTRNLGDLPSRVLVPARRHDTRHFGSYHCCLFASTGDFFSWKGELREDEKFLHLRVAHVQETGNENGFPTAFEIPNEDY